MSARRAIIGFKGIALAPITTNSVTSYVTGAGVGIPYAGQMNRTVKENKTDIYYDDDLYAQLRNVVGEDVELRMAEVPLSQLETLGMGTYNVTEETLEANFNIVNKYFAMRFVLNTVDDLPFYLNYRVFELTGIRFDNFVTKKESPSVCEVIISGVFKKPQLATAAPYSITQQKEDGSNLAFCSALLAMAEQLAACAVCDHLRSGYRHRQPDSGHRVCGPSVYAACLYFRTARGQGVRRVADCRGGTRAR